MAEAPFALPSASERCGHLAADLARGLALVVLLARGPARFDRLRSALRRGSRADEPKHPLEVLGRADATPAELRAALERALRLGGYDTARRLAERLERSSGPTLDPRCASALRELDRVYQRPAAEVCSRADPRASTRARADLPRARGPFERHLNAHNRSLLGAGTDIRHLRAYLRKLGLPDCERTTTSENFLSDLRFARPRRPRPGPLVTVIVTAYNASATLGYALDSVLEQDHRGLELLVADDASRDDTWRLLNARYAKYAHVRLFRSRENQGPYNLRNALLQQARGEFVAFQDADDLSLPTRLSTQLDVLLRSGAQACVSDWLRIRPDGSCVVFWDGRARRMAVVSLLARRSAFELLGPYPSARFGADLDLLRGFSLRFGAAAIARVRRPLLLGLWSERSLTRSSAAESLESGYRSPARRAYSEWLFQRDASGTLSRVPEDLLRETGNFVAPAPLLTAAETETT
jgi:hypothetical protein